MQIANLPTERLSLKQVAKHLRVHIATVYRWTLRGVRGRRLKFFSGWRSAIRRRG